MNVNGRSAAAWRSPNLAAVARHVGDLVRVAAALYERNGIERPMDAQRFDIHRNPRGHPARRASPTAAPPRRVSAHVNVGPNPAAAETEGRAGAATRNPSSKGCKLV